MTAVVRNRCYSCDLSLNKVPRAPMLHDEVWDRLSNPGERFLCLGCVFHRADERGVKLTAAELRPCPFNLFHWPHSFFDFFSRSGKPKATDEAAWREAWLELHPACMKPYGPEREPEQFVLPIDFARERSQ